MPLPEEVRDLASVILDRLDEAHGFSLNTRQAWRLVQQIADEGHPVRIIRYTLGAIIEVDEPDLLRCCALLRQSVEAMAEAAIRRSSGSSH